MSTLPSIRRWRSLEMKTKTFDCVAMKRQGAEKIMNALCGKNAREQLNYWAKGTKKLKAQQKQLRHQGR
jgi:hypothetical protein